MLKTDAQSRLYCVHYVPSNIDCSDCHSTEKDYLNRPLYAPLYIPLPNLPTVLDNSQLKLPSNFYVPFNNQKRNDALSNDCIEIKTKNDIIRVPQSTLVHRSHLNESNTYNKQFLTKNSACNSQEIFPGDFQNHAHRFTRSFSWKTKPEELPYAQMQPLPKLIKRPGYVEMCCKNICWPTHQLCLCCGRNTAESCRKWSKSTGEYDYIDACWSSCALCSDDAYKILNTPVVYNEKIIDPEVLLPLDAELLYYSIQSAKRQQEKQKKSSLQSLFSQQQTEEKNQSDNVIPFVVKKNDTNKLSSNLQNQETDTQSEIFKILPQKQQTLIPPTKVNKSKELPKIKSSKSVQKKLKKRITDNPFDTYLKTPVMGTRRSVKENDIFVVTANTGDIEFMVVKIDPSPYCAIGRNTNVHYENDPIEREEMEVLLNAIGYKDIGAVKKQLTQIKKMVEVPLKHPRLFEAIGINPCLQNRQGLGDESRFFKILTIISPVRNAYFVGIIPNQDFSTKNR
ncbi:unnamed protein product [Adineta steineri]|uniref:CDC48 domain-containing protein n=1 Tax=Adineta steineri TaxID=433720 RepID=A0A818LQ57_9BILA|nr:unnamed protein product [Adineta steineri]